MPPLPTRAAGLGRLAAFVPGAGRHYAAWRGHDAAPGGAGTRLAGLPHVSQLSCYLRAGLLDETEVIAAILAHHGPQAAQAFLRQIFWRIYFKGYLEQRPTIWRSFVDGRAAALAQAQADRDLASRVDRATSGTTGLGAFDHWARELATTGHLHNHARMWFSSIWIFTLGLPWELGADFFLRHLIDGDAAANTLSWRWVAGLHTPGKTYLARAENIARFTAHHPQGPLAAGNLASQAPALHEAAPHPARALPDAPQTLALDPARPYALLLHEEGASHVPLGALSHPPALVIGATRPQARSPLPIGAHAGRFAKGALAQGMAEASAAFACPQAPWPAGPATDRAPALAHLLAAHGISQVAMPYLPTGWTRDALEAELAHLAATGRLVERLPALCRASWPLAGGGFFALGKRIPDILAQVGLTG